MHGFCYHMLRRCFVDERGTDCVFSPPFLFEIYKMVRALLQSFFSFIRGRMFDVSVGPDDLRSIHLAPSFS